VGKKCALMETDAKFNGFLVVLLNRIDVLDLGIDFGKELLYSGLKISDKNYLRFQVLEM
jgi:hypothetical protein